MHWVNRILFALLVAGALTFLPERLPVAVAQTEDLERVRAERDALAKSNAALHEAIRQLRGEIDALKTDPREVARIAREDLNLVRPGEVVFEVERVTPTSP